MPATREDKIEDLVKLLYRLGAVRRELMTHALPELGGQGFIALAAVYRQGPARVSDIAAALNVDLSVASRQVQVLVQAGYVEREPDPEDGRATLLSLTDSGLQALRDSHHRMVAASQEALRDWETSEIEALSRSLARLREAWFPAPEPADADADANAGAKAAATADPKPTR